MSTHHNYNLYDVDLNQARWLVQHLPEISSAETLIKALEDFRPKILKRAQEVSKKSGGKVKATEWFNQHPVVLVCIAKMFTLSGGTLGADDARAAELYQTLLETKVAHLK